MPLKALSDKSKDKNNPEKVQVVMKRNTPLIGLRGMGSRCSHVTPHATRRGDERECCAAWARWPSAVTCRARAGAAPVTDGSDGPDALSSGSVAGLSRFHLIWFHHHSSLPEIKRTHPARLGSVVRFWFILMLTRALMESTNKTQFPELDGVGCIY